jgi:hypothetical protein
VIDMFTARTDHQLVAFGPNLLKLFDSNTGEQIAQASLDGTTWTIQADGIDDTTATSLKDAITAVTEAAIAKLGGTGYSTLVPKELSAAAAL